MDELEVSLFGPGVGECIVVHLGMGEWLVVDSCLNPETRAPVALEYLTTLGVNLSTQVRHVVVTHWHDDHMRGAARVLDAASSASFVCSAALKRSEFREFIAASDSLNVKAEDSAGVREFASVLAIVKARRAAGARQATVGPDWAAADKLVYRRLASNRAPQCEVFALSPSSQTLSKGLLEIAQLLPKVGETKRVAVGLEPNEASLVLSVRLGSALAVLGSDLETGASPGSGWQAVLSATAFPGSPSHAFKVPHHGSANAYHPAAWASLVTMSDTVAVLTPYMRGRTSLPTEADLARIKAHTKQVYCTAPRPARGAVADSTVQRTVNEVAREFRIRGARMGHVRVRMDAQQPKAAVERFGAAFAA